MKLNTLELKVLDILLNSKIARKSDFDLYLKVLEKLGISTRFSINRVLSSSTALDLPPFASVTRCRRRLQQKYPELKDNKVEDLRKEQEEEYIEYSRS